MMVKSEQNGRMEVYTSTEMLNEWKLRTQISNYHRGCLVERDDGIDLDGILLRELNQLYEKMLVEAPVEYLPVYDIAGDCRFQVNEEGAVHIVLPESCVRVVELRLSTIQKSLTEFVPEDSPLALMQQSEWTRGGTLHPVCVRGHRTLDVYAVSPNQPVTIEKLLAVCRPNAEMFEFSPYLWQQFKEGVNTKNIY